LQILQIKYNYSPTGLTHALGVVGACPANIHSFFFVFSEIRKISAGFEVTPRSSEEPVVSILTVKEYAKHEASTKLKLSPLSASFLLGFFLDHEKGRNNLSKKLGSLIHTWR
jgi:hypothetical protein